MTLFAFEPPIRHLKDFDDLQDFHFLLSMHCGDPVYINWYCTRDQRGDRRQLILDNSFNELGRADQVHSLVSQARCVMADRLVVPDDPTWPTERILVSFAKTTRYLDSNQVLVVVNSPSMHKQLKHYGARHFALSYHIRLPHYRSGGTPEDFQWAEELHFLGLCSINEIQVLQPPTCDTSMPIKLGMMFCSLEEWIHYDCPHVHTKSIVKSFFDARMTSTQLELARNNIIKMKELCYVPKIVPVEEVQ